MKHLFIVNPIAGKGKALSLIPEIHRFMEHKNGEEYKVVITQKPGDATVIAKRHAEEGVHRVYSVGGDGTLNEIVNGIVHSGSSVAIIPSGSGNDFIRSICRSHCAREMLQRSFEGSEKTIDLAKINDRYYINIASIGFDAEVVYNTMKFKKLPFVTGTLAYILGVLQTMLQLKNPQLKVQIDGRLHEEKTLLTAVANGKYYGGGMLPAPDAVLDDGKLDICLIKEKAILDILKFMPRFRKGSHGGVEGVSFYRGKKVRISGDDPLPLNVDGEVEKVMQAEFEIVPLALKIVIPREA